MKKLNEESQDMVINLNKSHIRQGADLSTLHRSSRVEASSIGSNSNNVTQDYISYPNKRTGYGKSLNYGSNPSHLRNLSCQQ